jgi:hypothetical protein
MEKWTSLFVMIKLVNLNLVTLSNLLTLVVLAPLIGILKKWS